MRIQMKHFITGEIFSEKGTTFQAITSFPKKGNIFQGITFSPL